jgi:hypothetical protein
LAVVVGGVVVGIVDAVVALVFEPPAAVVFVPAAVVVVPLELLLLLPQAAAMSPKLTSPAMTSTPDRRVVHFLVCCTILTPPVR